MKTTTLLEHFINDSVLFRVNTYDTDGVTLVTPLSVVCVVYNADTNAVVQVSDPGTTGAGFAEYNWSGNAAAATYEAVLSVTIESGVINSEHFRVVVLDKPPAFTLLITTAIGKVRRYIGDVKEDDGVFFGGANLADAEIQLALDNNGGVEYAAAAECCKWIATDWAKLPRRITVDSSLTIDRDGMIDHFRNLADDFETLAAGGQVGTVAMDRRDAWSVSAEQGGHPLKRETDTTYSD